MSENEEEEKKLKKWMQSKPVSKFLNTYSKNSRTTYSIVLKRYFKFLDIPPEEAIAEGRDCEEDMVNYARYLAEDNPPPKTYHSYTTIPSLFYKHNNIFLNGNVKAQIKRLHKGSRARTQDRKPTPEEVKRMLEHSNLRLKAIITFLISSGARIGETLQLKENDVDFNYNPTLVTFRGEYTKSGDTRISFISDLATRYLEEWLKEGKDKYLERAFKTTNLKGRNKKRHDERIFPFTHPGIRTSFVAMLKDIGLDERDNSTDRFILHFHSFRKFFLSNLMMPNDLKEYLAGHEGGYLTASYKRYDRDELAKCYLQEKHIFEFDKDIDQSKEIGELRKQIKDKHDISRKLSSLMKELSDLQVDVFQAETEEEKLGIRADISLLWGKIKDLKDSEEEDKEN